MKSSFDLSSRTVIVPLAGVVAEFRPHERLAALAEAAASDIATVSQALEDTGFVRACALGLYDASTMLTELRERLGADLTEAHLLGLWSLAYEPSVERIEALIEIGAERHILLAEDGPLLSAGWAAYLPELALGFPTRMLTSELGALTSDPACFEAIADRLETPVNMLSVLSTADVDDDLLAAARSCHVEIMDFE